MVTGDTAVTAGIVAQAIGLEGDVFAGTLPEGKYDLVKHFQQGGHNVGMCGDGANDAPALRQAQMGIAVSTATDVAKSAAGIVLTKPGLSGIVASIKEGRIIFQRILTYTLNSVSNKIGKMFFFAVGLVITGHAILTPLLMIISMLSGDLPGMSLTTDKVHPSAKPNVWQIGAITRAGVFMGFAELVFCTIILLIGKYHFAYRIETLQTLSFVAIVVANQVCTYLNRERHHLGSCAPSRWLIASTVVDLSIASVLSIGGIVMAPLPALVVSAIMLAALVFAFILDLIKVSVFNHLCIE